jgi:hypothetical protein
MARRCLLLTFTVAAFTSAAFAAPDDQRIKMGPVETGPGTLTAARKYLEGRWALLSYEIFPPDAPALRLDGEGTLVYDDFGNLEMDVRVDDKTAVVLEGVGIRTTDGRLVTKGRTVIDLQGRTLVFVLDQQPAFGVPAGPLALNRPRHWEVNGNELTLTTKGDDGRALSVSRWRKADR